MPTYPVFGEYILVVTIKLRSNFNKVKDTTELLMSIIHNEEKYVKSLRHTLKEDELTILRLKNKVNVLEAEIKKRKQLVEEYRVYLKRIPENTNSGMDLAPLLKSQTDLKLNNINVGMMNT